MFGAWSDWEDSKLLVAYGVYTVTSKYSTPPFLKRSGSF